MAQKLYNKPVIKRDKLPANFPHWAIIYTWIMYDIFGKGYQFYITLVLCILVVLAYFARKSIEITIKDER